MSKALTDLKNALSNAGDYITDLEVELEELDEYESLFENTDEARDIKDYYEEMSDIFDDTYDAQQAKELADAAEYAGWSDVYDIESAAEELERYRELGDIDEVIEAVQNSDGGTRVADLEKEIEQFTALVEQKDRQYASLVGDLLNRLGAVSFEFHEGQIEKLRLALEEEKRAGEEGAYEAGLNDGLILSKRADQEHGEQGIPLDLDLTNDEA